MATSKGRDFLLYGTGIGAGIMICSSVFSWVQAAHKLAVYTGIIGTVIFVGCNMVRFFSERVPTSPN